jgi:hypothetical protein
MADLSVADAGWGAWASIVKRAFPGNKGIQHGNPDIIICAGAPASFTAKSGTLCWDVTNSDAYIYTATPAWVKINS